MGSTGNTGESRIQIGKSGSRRAKAVHLQTALAELHEAEDYGTEEWFARCDSLWQEMLDGTQDFTVIEMDYFYRGCRIAAKGAMEERLVPGLEAYITLLEQCSAGSRRGGACLY